MRLRRLVKPVIDRVVPPLWRWYARKTRHARHQDVRVAVPPGVFHPHLHLSTRFLLQFLDGQDLRGKQLLELGAGSGMIAVWAAKRGAVVTASDISSLAIAALHGNAAANGVTITVLKADLFTGMEGLAFDRIVINPPYYPRQPQTEAEHAWYCGADFEYFQRLFAGLGAHCRDGAQVLMVLSEDCALDRIAAIAEAHGWILKTAAQRKRWAEWNYIFSIERRAGA